MSLVRPVPGFIPPVVALPAASAALPAVPSIVGGAAVVGGLIGGAPPLVVIGGAILTGVLLGAAIEQVWGWANGGRGAGVTEPDRPTQVPSGTVGGTLYESSTGTIRLWDTRGQGLQSLVPSPVSVWNEVVSTTINPDGSILERVYVWIATPSGSSAWPKEKGVFLNPGSLQTQFLIQQRPDGVNWEPLPAAPTQPDWDGSPFPLPPLLPEPLPEVAPQPEQPRPLPPLTVPTIPSTEPTTEPTPGPGPSPTPTPAAPPATEPTRPVTPFPGWPVQPRPDGTSTRPDGTLTPTPKPPPVKTPTGTHVIDGFPMPGNGPQPTPEGIAQELGRVEKKLARLIDTKSDAPGMPRDRLGFLLDSLETVIDFFRSITDGGEYEISSPCELDENGNRVVVKVPYPGALQSFGVLSNKIDAIAQLLQEHKNLKQPNCSTKPVLTGEWVTVNFQSDAASPGGERPLRKVLRYRDQTAAPLEDHLAHWESFAWDAGPVIVVSKNLSWGTPKVWAASAAEGKRVISHAALVAGVDLTDPKHEWVVTGSNDPRYGRTGRMRVDTRRGTFVRVTKRPGPSGLPSGFAPTP